MTAGLPAHVPSDSGFWGQAGSRSYLVTGDIPAGEESDLCFLVISKEKGEERGSQS
jgi:hypothetical protein